MNSRCTSAMRAVAFLAVTIALFLAPAIGQAQAIDCSRCSAFTIGVSPDLGCAVTVCYTFSPDGPLFCVTLAPGQSTSISCGVYQAWVNTCSGPYYLIPPNADALCSPVLTFAIGCCGRICNVPGPTRCTRLEIQPVPCASLSCP